MSVCLTLLAPEIRESLAANWAETIDVPNKWTNRLRHALRRHHCSPPTYPARKYGINHRTIIYKNIYTRFTKIDRFKVEIVHILVIIVAVTQIHGNRQKSRYTAKITVTTAILNSWFTYISKYKQNIIFCASPWSMSMSVAVGLYFLWSDGWLWLVEHCRETKKWNTGVICTNKVSLVFKLQRNAINQTWGCMTRLVHQFHRRSYVAAYILTEKKIF